MTAIHITAHGASKALAPCATDERANVGMGNSTVAVVTSKQQTIVMTSIVVGKSSNGPPVDRDRCVTFPEIKAKTKKLSHPTANLVGHGRGCVSRHCSLPCDVKGTVTIDEIMATGDHYRA